MKNFNTKDELYLACVEECFQHLTSYPVFQQFQDVVNAGYSSAEITDEEFVTREKSCLKALDILLYGIVDKEE